MPVLKAEASHYHSDLNNLLLCCQCVDVVFYHPEVTGVVEAHKIVLCAVSHVFMLLFNVKSPTDIQDSSIVRTTQDLFAINRDAVFPGASQESASNPPLRVIVKDAQFRSCLSDILRFIYSGTLSGAPGPFYSVKPPRSVRVLVNFTFIVPLPSEVTLTHEM